MRLSYLYTNNKKVARSCVALAHPIRGQIGAANRLETIPDDGEEPGDLFHGSLHVGNVMFGNPGGFKEHDLIPPVKLIDIGSAEESRDLGGGVRRNLEEISIVSNRRRMILINREANVLLLVNDGSHNETKATTCRQGVYVPQPGH